MAVDLNEDDVRKEYDRREDYLNDTTAHDEENYNDFIKKHGDPEDPDNFDIIHNQDKTEDEY